MCPSEPRSRPLVICLVFCRSAQTRKATQFFAFGGAPAPLVRPPRVLPHFSVLMRMVLLSLAACAYGLPSGKPNALLAKSDGHTSWEDSAPGGGGMTAFTLSFTPVDITAAPLPSLPQPRPRALPFLLCSGPSPFEATRLPSQGRFEAEDLRPDPLTGRTWNK